MRVIETIFYSNITIEVQVTDNNSVCIKRDYVSRTRDMFCNNLQEIIQNWS